MPDGTKNLFRSLALEPIIFLNKERGESYEGSKYNHIQKQL